MKLGRARVASGLALTLAVSAGVVYAVMADGYKAHEADLNDGGVWVVNGDRGWSGRLNKPINQLDGVVPNEGGKTRMDIIQDGAAVVTLDIGSARGQAIEPSRLETRDGSGAAVPAAGDVQMAGGTLASVDLESGKVWGVRYDDGVGSPSMNSIDRQSKALASGGKQAALAVSVSGTVVVTSADDLTFTTVAPAGVAFAKPVTRDLPTSAGEVSAVTTVGERIVSLDVDAGTIRVLDGASATVPTGSVLQQPGPDAASVLVASGQSLLQVGLDTGEVSTVQESSGEPVEPVRLGACIYGAWSGGQGNVVVQCGSQEADVSELGGDSTHLAFRVNRGEIVLNDAISGAVWDVDQDTPVKIDNWESFTSKKKKNDDDKKDSEAEAADRRPPLAKADTYGVREGRTTILHPLDNDSAPAGRLLSIVNVDQPGRGARVEISPDGQTLVLVMPERATRTSFDYYIDDGRSGARDSATVTVDVREPGSNTEPDVRQGYLKPTYKVPHGGALAVPVLSDWRDDRDGDPLLLDSAVAVGGEQSGAMARTTSDGRIRFTAPTSRDEPAQVVQVDYAVSDGRSGAVKRSINFDVQGPRDQESFPPQAEPDIVRGEVGKPIKIRPLLNDLPGSDPNTLNASLMLAGKVPQQPGAKISSDLEAGELTFVGDRAGTYFIKYDAGFGDAALDQGTIRVDVKARPKRASDPIAMPDSLTIYGQAPGIVDVLSNDLDPAGGLLVVQRAEPGSADSLDVAIIDGRWLRIASRQPDMAPATQTVSYTISNGANSAVRGEVVVTQRTAPQDNSPITVTDRVVVRAGTAVSAPVLDNDTSPSGDRLSLLTSLADGTPGELPVTVPVDVKGDVGRAFASGRLVRYVAPAAIKERDTFEVPYIAQNLDGLRATGRLMVTVVPADEPNQAPEPPTLEGRVVSGDTVKVRIPGVGVDANGDPVTVTGITSAPALGRIVAYGGNFLQYQAYPRTVGTDEFTYAVVDSNGALGTGLVRVAVVSPGEPQPPLAVEDRVTVEPGRTAIFDPLANDFIAAGDTVRIELLDPPAGASLDPSTNLVSVKAPKLLTAPSVTLVYRVTNGISDSRATMTLDTAADFNNPPVIYDAFGRADDSGSLVIDVLKGAYDPDGRASDLTVTDVYGDPSATVVDGVEVKVNRSASPKVLLFRVKDADGAAASASVYVPPTGKGLPYVRPGALIEIDAGGTVKGNVTDYVRAPEGASVRLAAGDRSWFASPLGLSVLAGEGTRFALSARSGFSGPGAVLVEVTTASDASGKQDASTAEDGSTALLSIPVQVGESVPVLECPSTPIALSAGQQLDFDISNFCKVSFGSGNGAGLAFQAAWTTRVDGVEAAAPQGSVVAITADEDASGGGEAVLSVSVGGSTAEEVRFRLDRAPPPSLLPIKVETMEVGETRQINLAPYLKAGVAQPRPTIVSVRSQGSPAVRASTSGSTLTLTATKEAGGAKASFAVSMSDVSSANPPKDRMAEGRIAFEVVSPPGAPGAPFALPNTEAETVSLSWRPPSDSGGAPILYYRVKQEGTNSEQRCDTNKCVIRKLKNNASYRFRARAVNRVGAGDWSEVSRSAQAYTVPGRVENIRMVSRGDGTITVEWDKPSTATGKILDYTISWKGGQDIVVGATSYTVRELDNNEKYFFNIKGRNKAGFSLLRSSPPMQSVGTPSAPNGLSATDLDAGVERTDVRLEWAATLPEGPAPTTYSLYVADGANNTPVPGCQRITSVSCIHSGVTYAGQILSYTVMAYNEPGNRSVASAPAPFQAVGRPAEWGSYTALPTGANQTIQINYTVPDSRGTVSRVEILVDGALSKPFSDQRGTRSTQVLVGNNENPHNIQLKVCNEKTCTLSAQQQVQSYGGLADSLAGISEPVVDGRQVTWTVTGTSNGNPAELVIRIDGGPAQVIALSGVGAFSQPFSTTTKEWGQDVKIDVTLQDPSPGGRGSASKMLWSRSGPPPAPTLSVSRGALCNDMDGDSANDCGSGVQPQCDSASCGYVNYTVSGFLDDFGCRVSNPDKSWWWNGSVQPHPAGDFGTMNTWWYYPSGYVTVTCRANGGYQQEVAASINWP